MADQFDDPTLDPVVQDAINCFKLVSTDAESEQRQREDEDLAFDAGDQWPDSVKASRRAQNIGGVDIPARPMLTIPKLDQPVQLVINQQRRAHLGITVSPENETANPETAEVLQGIIRHIQTHSRAEMARNWAFERSVKAGRGYYRILKRYVDQTGAGEHWSDQELCIQRVLNQGSVYLDPYAVEPDWSDGEWGLIGGFMPEKRFRQRWPKAKMTTALDDDDFGSSEGDIEPNWMSSDIEGYRGVRVMEFFRVQHLSRTRVSYLEPDATGQMGRQNGYLDELGDEWWTTNKDRVDVRRNVDERKVMWYTLNALEVLEQEEWDGRYIPIIPVIGREQYFKNRRRWVGIIRPAQDGQRLFNYAATSAVEKEAIDTKAPWIGYEGQFKGHEEAWSQASTRNFPYLQVSPVTIGGQPAPLPQRNTAGSNISGSLALLEAADQFIKAATFTYDPSLGNARSGDSGRKVLALQTQGEEGNSNYLDNLVTISMPFEAMQLVDLIPKVYDRPGRIQQVLGVEGDEKAVMLNAPFVSGPDGRPQAVDMAAQGAKLYDLTKGRYTTAITIGKSYNSRLLQGVDEMNQLLQAAPELLKVIGDIYFKFRDFPGHTEISERFKKMLPPELADRENAEDPEQLKSQLAQQQQAMEQLQSAFQNAVQQLETKQVEAGAKVQSEQVKADAAMQLEQLRQQGNLMLAEIDADLKVRLAQVQAGLKQAEQARQVAADTVTREDEQRHDLAMLETEHAIKTDEAQVAYERAEASAEANDDRAEARAERTAQRDTETDGS